MKVNSRLVMFAVFWSVLSSAVLFAQSSNEILMPRWGKQVVTVSEEMTFYDYMGTNDIASSSSSNTLGTIVFKPSEPGKAIKIIFEEFDLRTDLSTYQGYAIIYNGEVDPENTFTYPQTTGGVTASSTLPDGALTVVFDAKTTSSSYTAKGWDAEVREYQSKPKTVETISATQLADGTVKAGARNQEVIALNIQTKGDSDAPEVSALTFDLKGSQNSIEKAYLFYNGADNAIIKDNAIATIDINAETSSLNIVLASPVRLKEGDNNFILSYDIDIDAAIENNIDAALVSIKVNNETLTPEEGACDPEGFGTIKNLFLLNSGDNGEITIGENSLMFYDNGGPEGQTPANFSGTVTFAPRDAGKVIKMIFKQWKPNGNYDKMLVYYGGSVASAEDLKIISQETLPADVVSKSPDGKLTVKFDSPSYSYKSDGWEIEVCQYELAPLSVSGISTVSVAPLQVMSGETNVPMLDVAVVIEGDKGEIELTAIKTSTNSTSENNISGVSVFATGVSTAFSETNKIMSSDVAPYELTGSYKITNPGTYHFWVTYNVASDAEIFDKLKLSLSSATISGEEYQTSETVIAETKVEKGFSGTLTVGDGCEYTTIQSAINAIKDGIDGPVIINVKKGEYKEDVKVPNIPGTSEINTITLQSESGNRNDVLIYNTYYNEPTYSDDKMNEEYGVFTFDGVDYFTLKSVSVTATDLNYQSVVHYRNQSRHVTIEDCHIYADRSESASSTEDIRLVYQYAKNEENMNNDYPTVRKCLLEGGYMGINIQGTSFVKLPKQCGAVIEGNTFRDQGYKALYSASKERDMVIRNNIFENTTTAKTGFQAIDIETSEGCIIDGNSFYLETSSDAVAINVRGIAGTEEKPGIIKNNEIAVACGGLTSAGIKLNSASSFVKIANNTVLITAGKSTSQKNGVALWLNNTTTGVEIINNILMEKEGGYVYRFYKDNCIDGVKFSNNVLFTDGAEFAYSNPTKFTTFEDWMAAKNEKDSYNENTDFYSSTILFPVETGSLQNGLPLNYVTTDKDGATRSETASTIGAYEYSESEETPEYAPGYPSFGGINNNSAIADLKVNMNGAAYTIVLKATEPEPTADDVIASATVTELRKDKITSITLDNLSRQTEYKLYSVLMSLNGLGISDVIASEPFSTTFDPTEVSTFENVTETDFGFSDGTADFTGFTVEAVNDAVVEGSKAAKIGENAIISLNNTDNGLTLTGFFLKSDDTVDMTVIDGNGQPKVYSLDTTNNSWLFINLKNKGLITKVSFETTGNAYIDNFSGEPLALSVETSEEEISINEGENTSIAAIVSGGVTPYTYSWTNAANEVVNSEANCALTPQHSGVYKLTVTDAWNNISERYVTIYVSGQSYVATFDDNYLEEESFYNGLGEENGDYTFPGTDSKFFSGSFGFDTNKHTSIWWGGFGISNQTSTEYNSIADQFKSAAGSGHNSANYGVAYTSIFDSYAIEVSNARETGETITGFYVTNSAYTADAIINGDGMSTPNTGFEKGDYLKLIITAEKADGTYSSVDYYLADYRSENANDHYYLNTWQWVDLRSLENAKKFTFAFEGTKKNDWGLTTPTYFCLDDFGGSREITDAPEQLAGTSAEVAINLTELFSFENDDATINFAITDNDDANLSSSIENDNLLVKGKNDNTETEVIVSAMQKGKLQFIRIPINVNEEKFATVCDVEIKTVSIYPVPATDWLNIRTELSDYAFTITNTDGVNIINIDNCSGNAKCDVSHLQKGVYFLTIKNKSALITKRFIKK